MYSCHCWLLLHYSWPFMSGCETRARYHAKKGQASTARPAGNPPSAHRPAQPAETSDLTLRSGRLAYPDMESDRDDYAVMHDGMIVGRIVQVSLAANEQR